MSAAAPLISVITPTYRRLSCLRELAACLLRQRHQRWEWLIVADGHDPEVQAFVEELGDRRARYLHTPPTRDLGSAQRNLGLLQASGELVVYVDDDNLVCEDYLGALAEPCVERGADWALCSIRMDEDYVLSPRLPLAPGKIDTLCLIVRRRLALQVPGGWVHDILHDYIFIQAVCGLGPGEIVPRVLAQHRSVDGTLAQRLYRRLPAPIKQLYRAGKRLLGRG